MKYFSFIILCILVSAAAFSAGCSGGDKTAEAATPVPTTPPPVNVTYDNHGIRFVYLNNLALTEHDSATGPGAVSWESGEVHLKDRSGDNLTVMWMAMKHKPPNIPVLYESMRTSFQKDPRMSDVKYFLLQTSPSTTCNVTTFVGHVSYLDKVKNARTNEAIVFWYYPKQDRTYIVDWASAKDYDSYLKGKILDFQQSFRCVDG